MHTEGYRKLIFVNIVETKVKSHYEGFEVDGRSIGVPGILGHLVFIFYMFGNIYVRLSVSIKEILEKTF